MTAKHCIKLRTKELKDGRKTLYLDYEKGGKRVREALHLYLLPETSQRAIAANKRTMKDAQALLLEREKELAYYNHGIEDIPLAGKSLLSVIDDYAAKLCAANAASSRNMPTVRRAIIEYSGEDVDLSRVDKNFCVGFMEFLLKSFKSKDNKNLTANGADCVVHLFSSSLNFAVDNGYMRKNPMRLLKISDYVKRQKNEKTYLTADEVKMLMDTQCPVLSRPQVKQSFLFSCFTGLSYSDVTGLMWKDIKTEDGIVTVPQKSRGNRVPLSEIARRWLPDVKDKRGLVFKGLPSSTRVCSILKDWSAKAGIGKHIKFSVARNTFAYLLLTSGTSLETLAELWNLRGINRKYWLQEYANMAGIHTPLTL